MNRQMFFVLLLVVGILLTISQVKAHFEHLGRVGMRTPLRRKRGSFFLTEKKIVPFSFIQVFVYLSYKVIRLKWTVDMFIFDPQHI